MIHFFQSMSQFIIIAGIMIIIIVGISLYCRYRLKWSNKQTLYIIASIVTLIASTAFLSTILRMYGMEDGQSIWTMATAVYSLLGTILTVGATFSGITAIISYISINDKLKEAKQDLDLASHNLQQFQNLFDKQTQLKQQIQQMENYSVLIHNLEQQTIFNKTEEEIIQIKNIADSILQTESSSFEHRLKAYAMKQDIIFSENLNKIRSLIYSKNGIVILKNSQLSNIKWAEIMHAQMEILSCWKLIYQTSTEYKSTYNKQNYAHSLYNYATLVALHGESILNIETFIKCSHTIISNENVNFNLLVDKFKIAINFYEQAFNIDNNMYHSLRCQGICLDRQACITAINQSNLEQAKILWSESLDKYESAWLICNDEEILHDWADTLYRQGIILKDINIISNAIDKYLESLLLNSDMTASIDSLVEIISKDIDTWVELEEKFKIYQTILEKLNHQTHNAIYSNLIDLLHKSIKNINKNRQD